MKFDFKNNYDVKTARTYLDKLISDQSKCDMVKPREVRSVSQNSYVHVCIDIFAIEFGYTRDEAKTHLKRKCTFMRYEKNGELFLVKTSLQSTKELRDFIEWIRTYSAKEGCYIPDASEYLLNKFNIDRDIERNKEYL